MHICFENLDFIIMMGESWCRLPSLFNLSTLSASTRSPRRLMSCRLHASEARTPGSDQLLGFNYGRLERQLGAFPGPRPSWENLRHLTFLFANVMT